MVPQIGKARKVVAKSSAMEGGKRIKNRLSFLPSMKCRVSQDKLALMPSAQPNTTSGRSCYGPKLFASSENRFVGLPNDSFHPIGSGGVFSEYVRIRTSARATKLPVVMWLKPRKVVVDDDLTTSLSRKLTLDDDDNLAQTTLGLQTIRPEMSMSSGPQEEEKDDNDENNFDGFVAPVVANSDNDKHVLLTPNPRGFFPIDDDDDNDYRDGYNDHTKNTDGRSSCSFNTQFLSPPALLGQRTTNITTTTSSNVLDIEAMGPIPSSIFLPAMDDDGDFISQ